MAVLAADYKLLHSRDASVTSKTEAAERLLPSLTLGTQGGGSGYEGHPTQGSLPALLPPLVRFHYLKGLLDWATNAVTKGASSSKKGAAQGLSSQEGRLHPGCWRTLVSVLSCDAVQPSYQVPAALLPAAVSLLGQLAAGASGAQQPALPQDQALQLLEQCGRLLQLLSGKFGGSQRAPLEHAVALAENALLGLEGAACEASSSADVSRQRELEQAWGTVALGAVSILQVTVAAHPVARKVWEAVLPRLALPLAAAAFPEAGMSGQPAEGLAAQSRALLEAVIYNPAHIPGLAGMCKAEFAAASAAADDPAGVGTEQAVDGSEASRGHRHYAAQWFELLAACLLPAQEASKQQQQEQQQQEQQPKKKKARREGPKAAAAGQQGVQALQVGDAAGSVLRMLPWALERYCAALSKYRRAAETEATLLKQSALAKRQGHEDEDAVQDSAVPAAADFQMFASLLGLLLKRANWLASSGNPSSEGTEPLAAAVRAMARLAVPLKSCQVYRPTQDPGGTHRAMLQRLADTVLALVAQQDSGGGGGSGAGSSAGGVGTAALEVVQGILAVEHRPIQEHLTALWALLLAPQTVLQQEGSSAAAVAVAAGLVGAYAELRQLEVLLASLAHALLGSQGAARRGGQALAVASPEAADAAAAVVCSGEFVGSLRAAVQGLPSGQAAAVVKWVAGGAGLLSGREPSDPMVALFTEVCACLLASLPVDLTTAPAVAQAAESLVAALGPPLLQLLTLVEEFKLPVGGSLLPALLELYTLALQLHARCAALHPQVKALPGQQEHVRAEDLAGGSSQTSSLLRGSYFAALQQGAAANSRAPALLPVLQALLFQQAQQGAGSRRKSKGGSGAAAAAVGGQPAASGPGDASQSSLALAAMRAAVRRLAVLHEQHLYLQHLCPTAAAVPSAKQGLGQGQGQGIEEGEELMAEARADEKEAEQLALQRTAAAAQLRQACEEELRGIAGLVLEAAAAALGAAAAAGLGHSGAAGAQQERAYAAAVLEMVTAQAGRLQAWAPLSSLQAVLQACMQLATSAAPQDADLRAASLRLLHHPDLLEWQGTRQALLRALCSQLYPSLRDLAECLPPQAAEAALPSKKHKNKRAGAETTPLAAPSEAGAAQDGGPSQLEALAAHVKRLSKGKPVKADAWAADMATCLRQATAAAAALAAAGPAAGAAAAAAGAGGEGALGAAPTTASKQGKKDKKRSLEEGPALSEGGLGAMGGRLQQASQAVEAAGALLALVAPLPLQYLGSTSSTTTSSTTSSSNDGEEEEEAGGVAHAALAAVVVLCTAGARCLLQSGIQQERARALALGVLRALSSGLLLLNKALAAAWVPHSGSGPQRGVDVGAPALLLVRDWPALLAALATAAAGLAASAGTGTQPPGTGSGSGGSGSGADAGPSCLQLLQQVWGHCGSLMAAYTAACLVSPGCSASAGAAQQQAASRQRLQQWLVSLPEQLSLEGAVSPSAAGAAVLAEACLAACHSCLLAAEAGAGAAAAAGAGSSGGSKGRRQAHQGAAASEVACGPGAVLSFLDSGSYSVPGDSEAWVMHRVLAQCVEPGGAEVDAPLLVSTVQQLQQELVRAALSAGADQSEGSWLQHEALACVYGSMAHALRMLCISHPAADALHAAGGKQQAALGADKGGSGSGSGSITASLGPLGQQAARRLLGSGTGTAGLASSDVGGGSMSGQLQLVHFLGTCCQLTHHMRPSPSPAHFASLLALLLCLLRALRPCRAGLALDPTRHTLPFAALFPAACTCTLASAQHGSGSSAAGAAQVRQAALEALRALVDGCTTQQLSHMLRYVERSLASTPSMPSMPSMDSSTSGLPPAAGGSQEAAVGGGAGALAVAELALVLLEASTGGRAGRVLSQHGERLAGVLIGCLTWQRAPAAAAADGTGSQGQLQGLQGVMRAVLAAAGPAAAAEPSPEPNSLQQAEQQQRQQPGPQQQRQQPGPQQQGQQQPDVATLCTVLRALESMAARPQVFALSARHVSNMLHGVAAVWAGYRAWPCHSSPGLEPSSAPAVPQALSVADGAALFTGSCALLLALLRHRAEALGRCIPLLAQALRTLLAWLVGAELAAKLAPGREGDEPAWRVKCAEALARVLTEIATLKAATSRYCPHLLADYLLLAASPLTPKAYALLGLGGGEDVGGLLQLEGRGTGEEAEALAGPPLCAETAAALRQGAYAVYGACSPSELQYLYASLGQKGGAGWRTALAALKSDYEQHFKYTGKV